LGSREMIYVGKSNRGRGIFAGRKFVKGEIIEKCPIIVIPAAEWEYIEKTVLYNYCFSWGKDMEDAAIALGLGSLYNHSYTPNALYINNLPQMSIEFISLKDIEEGEEITVNYNRDPDNKKPLWFEVVD
jgi:uncharacterized protein